MKKRLQQTMRKQAGITAVLLFVFNLCLIGTTCAQQQYWQQRVNHLIDVTLDDNQHSLDGFEKIEYTNNAPDTLTFIWFHIWPNAFKNDQTAFSEQLLLNANTDFYFSDKDKRGYINRLDFKVDGVAAKTEDHAEYIDVIRLNLPQPLPPGKTAVITTPFHVQLPFNFSRGGHTGQSYQVTQWFPKPAVYDRNGWHPMPYLDQGEFYSEFGHYDVRITLPANYVVAASGVLMNDEEKAWLITRGKNEWLLKPAPVKPSIKGKGKKPKQITDTLPASAKETKTLRYVQDNIHDFAWFADKRYQVKQDTLLLPSGRKVDLFYFAYPGSIQGSIAIPYMKEALRLRSVWIGEYAFSSFSVVEADMGVYGGMEYPSITSISPVKNEKELDLLIAHEAGHNWFYGMLANNERRYPWMDEGMNTYFDDRYEQLRYGEPGASKKTFISKRIPPRLDPLQFETLAALKKDQPINTTSEAFNTENYGLISYYKAAEWMKLLEKQIGMDAFDDAMKKYFETWKFRHPGPEDFKQVMEASSGKNLDSIFRLLDQKGSLNPPVAKQIRLTTYFNLNQTDKYNYISLAPAAGYNLYDGVMIGLLVHNYQLPFNRLQFVAAPLYATRSKTLNGIGRISYSGYPGTGISKWEAGITASHFTMDDLDRGEEGRKFLSFTKFVPFLKLKLHQAPLSKLSRYFQVKGFFINEDEYDFRQVINGSDTSEVVNIISGSNQIAEGKYVMENTRALYPWKAELAYQQHKYFSRLQFTGNYFFNYPASKGGVNARLFAGKFFYMSAAPENFYADRFLLNLTGPKGDEDYTYSNYFIGRNEFEKWPSQQIMIRDGAFKVGTDLQADKVGKTDNWLVASNFTLDVPARLNPLQVLPVKIPLKIFADFGTAAEAWQEGAQGGRFLYDAGFQFSFFRETVNIYVPVFYSRIYRDYYRSMFGQGYFFNTISFSFHMSDMAIRKITGDFPF